ncbi:primase-helicase family protein [Bradyrhizobium japonicum]|uniref:primase-helicase family protein n=1 Tax=Bradyrhizobium japonicum TaxID=375 RepID=UPI0004B586F2|nr:primase-helicase family protein [Bradyrhizobium japonicum]
MNFLAHLVQRPQERIGHALLITSEAKGIGKSTLGTVVRRLVGEQNSRVAQTKDLKSSFDGWLIGKLVVQVDEVYEAGNWDLANKLKPLITEPTVSANIKYGPQLEIENYARFIMFSNHSAPLNIEEGDRRYFVFNSKAQPRDDEYYDRLYGYIETPEAMEALYGFLMRRDLSSFNPFRRPPMTDAKRQIIAESEHPLHTYIIDAVVSGHFRRELGAEFSFDALARQLSKDGYGAQAKNTKEVGTALRLAGVTQVRKTAGDGKVRMYVLPASEDDGDDEDHKF